MLLLLSWSREKRGSASTRETRERGLLNLRLLEVEKLCPNNPLPYTALIVLPAKNSNNLSFFTRISLRLRIFPV